jgi:drug/metabolite transporter (DMT)-like permease
MFLLLGLATEGPGSVARLTAGQWAATAYLAVLVTAVAFLCWYSTVAALGADVAGVLTGITPVVAALAGLALDGRMPAMSVWLGIGVVCCGLALGLVRRRTSCAAARAAA